MTNAELKKYFSGFRLSDSNSQIKNTVLDYFKFEDNLFPRFVNEFWTSKQRQNNPIHEISYRACYKAELPRFFISLLSNEKDVVYDPFSGRGTTIIEAALLNRF